MGLIECPDCTRKVSAYAIACPRCGFPVSTTTGHGATISEQGPTALVREKPVSPSENSAAAIEYDILKKSPGVAFAFWFFLGMLGGHRFYASRAVSAVFIPVVLAIGVFFFASEYDETIAFGAVILMAGGSWVLIDGFLIPSWIRDHNQGIRGRVFGETSRTSKVQSSAATGNVSDMRVVIKCPSPGCNTEESLLAKDRFAKENYTVFRPKVSFWGSWTLTCSVCGSSHAYDLFAGAIKKNI